MAKRGSFSVVWIAILWSCQSLNDLDIVYLWKMFLFLISFHLASLIFHFLLHHASAMISMSTLTWMWNGLGSGPGHGHQGQHWHRILSGCWNFKGMQGCSVLWSTKFITTRSVRSFLMTSWQLGPGVQDCWHLRRVESTLSLILTLTLMLTLECWRRHYVCRHCWNYFTDDTDKEEGA